MRKISRTSGKKEATMDSGARRVTPDPSAVDSTLIAVALETISELSHPSHRPVSSQPVYTETSRTFRFPQSTSTNSGEGTSGRALEAHGQPENLPSCPCMPSAGGQERPGPSAKKRVRHHSHSKWPHAKGATDQRNGSPSRKRQRRSQESAQCVSERVSTSTRQDHTHSPSPDRRNEPLFQGHQSTLGSSQDENSSQPEAIPSTDTAVPPHPPMGTEEPLTLHPPATSTPLLHPQQQNILILRHHEGSPQGIIPTFSVHPLTMHTPSLEMLEEQLQEAQAEIQELHVLLERLEEDRLGSLPTAGNKKLPYYRFDLSNNQFEQNQCVVCMCDFQSQQLLRVLSCEHVFHATCVNKWLELNSSCPLCRVKVKRDSR